MSLRVILEYGNINGISHMVWAIFPYIMVLAVTFLGCLAAFGPELVEWRKEARSSDHLRLPAEETHAAMVDTDFDFRSADTTGLYGG